jgi:hypothetical protein
LSLLINAGRAVTTRAAGARLRQSLVTIAAVSAVTAAMASPAGNWSQPRRLSPEGRIAIYPDLGVDGRGDVIAVWGTSLGPPAYGHVFVTERHGQAKDWSRPLRLSSARRFAGWPRIAVDFAGAAVAVWQDGGVSRAPSESVPAIDIAFRDRYGRWSQPRRLSRAGNGSAQPAVAINQRGEALVAWMSVIRNGSGIEVSLCEMGRQRCSSPRTLTKSDGAVLDPQVAISRGGDAIVVWTRRLSGGPLNMKGTRFRVSAEVRSSKSRWLGPVGLGTEVDSSGQGSASGEVPGPRVGVDAEGDAVVVWQGPSAGQVVTQSASWHEKRRSWTRATVISQMPSQMPDVAVAPDATAIVVWRGEAGLLEAVQGSVRSDIWSQPHTISRELALYPTVAIDHYGNGVAAWGGDRVQAAAWRRGAASWGRPTNVGANIGGGQIQLGLDWLGTSYAVWQRPTSQPRGIVIESAELGP